MNGWHLTIKSSLNPEKNLKCEEDFCQVGASFVD